MKMKILKEFKAGDKVGNISGDIEGTIVKEIDAGTDEFDRLVAQYHKDYGVEFFETIPTPEPPFYVVDVDGEEELFSGEELMIV